MTNERDPHEPDNQPNASTPAQLSDWHQFLRETYGAFRDTPIQRWEQGEYEEREPLASG